MAAAFLGIVGPQRIGEIGGACRGVLQRRDVVFAGVEDVLARRIEAVVELTRTLAQPRELVHVGVVLRDERLLPLLQARDELLPLVEERVELRRLLLDGVGGAPVAQDAARDDARAAYLLLLAQQILRPILEPRRMARPRRRVFRARVDAGQSQAGERQHDRERAAHRRPRRDPPPIAGRQKSVGRRYFTTFGK